MASRIRYHVRKLTTDGRLDAPLAVFSTLEEAEAHRDKFDAWHNTHGRLEYAYIRVVEYCEHGERVGAFCQSCESRRVG